LSDGHEGGLTQGGGLLEARPWARHLEEREPRGVKQPATMYPGSGTVAMSTTSMMTPGPPPIPATVYRISVDEYERMIDAGILNDPRIELLA
jgi:hypothetical protein